MNRVQMSGWVLIGAAWVTILLTLLSAASASLRIRIRIRGGRRPRPKVLLGRGLSVLGFALALSSSPASAQGRPPVPPGRVSPDVPPPPWTVTGGSPPPQRPVPSEATPSGPGRSEEGVEVDGMERPRRMAELAEDAPDGDAGAALIETALDREIDGDAEYGGSAHPAVHGRRGRGPVSPLFPRAGSKIAPAPFDERLDRLAAMERHPAGKGLESRATRRGRAPGAGGGAGSDAAINRQAPATYTVRAGDSLWSIAAEVLGTDDLVRIARYWPRIHRSNPHISDPDLIRPGEVLRLPEETSR